MNGSQVCYSYQSEKTYSIYQSRSVMMLLMPLMPVISMTLIMSTFVAF